MFQLTIHRTKFTENEVFGTGCGDCDHSDFNPATPKVCAKCGSDNLNPADGCEIPYDDDHTATEVVDVESVPALAETLRSLGTTYYDGCDTFTDPDGSTVVDYGKGQREEVIVRVTRDGWELPMVSLACDRAARRVREGIAA